MVTDCKHQWVMMTETKVSIILDKGEPKVFIDPDEEVKQVVGCNLCEVELTQAYLP